MLSAIVDGQLHVWYYPTVVFVDHDLKEHTTTIGEVGNSSTGGRSSDAATNFRQGSIVGFYGVQCLVRRADGAIISVSGISPYPVVLMEVLRKKQWEEAVKLCRFIKVRRCCGSVISDHTR